MVVCFHVYYDDIGIEQYDETTKGSNGRLIKVVTAKLLEFKGKSSDDVLNDETTNDLKQIFKTLSSTTTTGFEGYTTV